MSRGSYTAFDFRRSAQTRGIAGLASTTMVWFYVLMESASRDRFVLHHAQKILAILLLCVI